MSIAQIELMCADCSVTVYPKTDKVKGGKKGIEFSKPEKGALEAATERWKERQARKARGEDVGINLSEFEAM